MPCQYDPRNVTEYHQQGVWLSILEDRTRRLVGSDERREEPQSHRPSHPGAAPTLDPATLGR
jgi:hypothetical protein